MNVHIPRRQEKFQTETISSDRITEPRGLVSSLGFSPKRHVIPNAVGTASLLNVLPFQVKTCSAPLTDITNSVGILGGKGAGISAR